MNDVLGIIFSNLSIIDLVKCRLVNKMWKQVVDKNPGLFKLSTIKWEDFDRYPFDSIDDCFPTYEWVINETIPEVNLPELVGKFKGSRYMFLEENITEVYFYQNGQKDESNWYILGKLVSGYYFYMEAGCDCCGFDCQGSIQFTFSHHLINLIKFGLDNKSRKLLFDLN